MPPSFSNLPRARSLALLCCLSVGLGAACAQLPHRYGKNVVMLPSGGLLEASPADVVVAPIIIADTQTAGETPTDVLLRRALQEFLPLRRYTPLALDYVDERAVEASYQPGTCDEGATLQVTVLSWDERHWDTRGTVEVVIEARLLDAQGKYTQPLWAGRLEQVMTAGGRRQSHSNKQQLMTSICAEIAHELLEKLPPRQVDAGRL